MNTSQLTLRQRYAVLARDDFTCQYCGRRAPDVVLHVDHSMPRSRGGPNDPWNLITACRECNAGKGDQLFSTDYASPADIADVFAQLLAHGPWIGPHLILAEIECLSRLHRSWAAFHEALWGYLGHLDFDAEKESR